MNILEEKEVNKSLLSSAIKQTIHFQAIQMHKKQKANHIYELAKVKRPSLLQNQGTFRCTPMQVTYFFLTLEPILKVCYS